MLVALLLSQLVTAAPLHVLVDPGHGGRDHGAVRESVFESDITLQVAQKLKEHLAKDRRFRVSLTRQSDESLSLAQRGAKAHEKRADVLVSIHVNSSPDPRAKGAEFYFQNQLPPDEESMFLAHRENDLEQGTASPSSYDIKGFSSEVTAIVTDLFDSQRIWRSSQLCRHLKSSWRGTSKSKSNSVRQAPFFVLSQLAIPSVLVEIGFLTNDEDMAQMTDAKTQGRIAEDLYRGLIQYRESITTGHASRQP